MTEDKSPNFKKGFVNYMDITLAIINSLIIIFPLIIIHKNISISIVGIILSFISLTLVFYTFTNNNPLYIYFCYSLLIAGVLFLIPSIMINVIFSILVVPEICFIYNVSKGKSQTSTLSSYAKMQYLRRFGLQYGMDAKQLTQQWDNINPELELKKTQQRELFEKQYNSKKILISSLLLILSLITVFVLFTATYIYS